MTIRRTQPKKPVCHLPDPRRPLPFHDEAGPADADLAPARAERPVDHRFNLALRGF